MTSKEWEARLERLEHRKDRLENLQTEFDPNSAMQRTFEKELERINQDIDSCITSIEQAKKREKFMKKEKSNQSEIQVAKMRGIV